MDYQKARGIRKRSLLSLITEQKFGEGKGLGSSVGGAISQKFKAKATGIKESLDPMNWLRKSMGKGAVGDFAVSAWGKMRGRSNKDIEAFGGIGRKKVKNKKDPQFTTIGAGPVKPLQRGDGVADVLGKMFNFMVKTDELHKLNTEIDKTFRQEEMDEDDRRHNKLVETIKKYMRVPKGEAKSEGGFLDDLIKMIKEIWDHIKEYIMPIIEAMTAVFSGIWGTILKAASLVGLDLAIAAAPLALLGLAAYAAAPDKTGGNTEAQTNVMNKIQEKSDFKPTKAGEVVPDEDLKKDSWLGASPAKKARKSRIEKSFELGTEYSPEDAKKIKTAYGVDVPEYNIKEITPENKESSPTTTPTTTKEESSPTTTHKQAPTKAEPKNSKPNPVSAEPLATEPPKSQPVQQPVVTSVPTPLPTQTSNGNDGAPNFSVNNTNNIIGSKSEPKIIQTSSAKIRNVDLNRYLSKGSVVV